MATGSSFESVFSAMQRLAPVRGRLERAVISRAGAPVYVDYAHTPDALEAAIAALRPHVSNRLITVFGAGGDRDQGKRPEMGAVAAKLSDVVIVTDDNPRGEDAAKIRAEILAGAPGALEIGGRREAIAAAIRMAVQGDIILLAGKGHETGSDHRRGIEPAHPALRRCARRPGVRGMSVLWTSAEIEAATGGRANTSFEVSGVAFDSREVEPGDLFVAMKGEVYDGHHFVEGAFAAGAAGAIVSQPVDGPHVLVEDTAGRSKTLAARRANAKARIVGVTGSVGKTGTKEALFAALDRSAEAGPTARSRATTTTPACRSASRGCRARPSSRCSRWA